MRKNSALNLDPLFPDKPQQRRCEHPGCTEAGDYPAPKSRHNMEDRVWLCLEHVREHNSQWNFCEGLSEKEIEDLVRKDATWQRETSRLGRWGNLRAEDAWKAYRAGAKDKYGFFEDDDPDNPFAKAKRRAYGEDKSKKEHQHHHSRRGYGFHGTSEAEKALAALDLSPPVTFDQIRERYKHLVKRFHPDTNGGDKHSEEKMKIVNQAYSVLKQAHAALKTEEPEKTKRR